MLRYLTAGESHGPALVGVLEGMPAGVPYHRDALERALERRRLGHGRSPRMNFEADRFEVLGGVRHGLTLGSPIAVVISNTEWPKWQEAMAAEAPADPQAINESARGAALTRPRPGHADLAGMQKYGFDDARNVLERASARETAARVAAGPLAKAPLAELGVEIVSHVGALGAVALEAAGRPGPADLEGGDAPEGR